VCFKWAGVGSQLRALEELGRRVDNVKNASTADDILKVYRIPTERELVFRLSDCRGGLKTATSR
jgi:hypothetical protein